MELLDTDLEFWQSNKHLMRRFYDLFDAIYKYLQDYLKFLEDVESGFYIQHTVDGILENVDGKQLLSEALYLYGMMLLLLEKHIPGPVREKMIVSVYRHDGEIKLPNIEEVCRLCKDPKSSSKKLQKYPENFFGRFDIPQHILRSIIGRLVSDDLYVMTPVFPNPDQKSTRLANQAAHIYVILYFLPQILKEEEITMREVVDRHFADSWIIPLYMGHIIDLSEVWRKYPAAEQALKNVLILKRVKDLEVSNARSLGESLDELQVYLTEGVLTREYVIDNIQRIFNTLRNANVSIRWRMLHGRSSNPIMSKILDKSEVTQDFFLNLILFTSQLEFRLKDLLEELLDARWDDWDDGREASGERLLELSEYFTGEKALTRVERDEELMKYFSALSSEVVSLDLEDQHTTITGRKIQEIIRSLEDIEQFDKIDNDLQIKAFLEETRLILRQMIRTVNLDDSLLGMLETISDMSYCWEVLPEYLEVMHTKIAQDPTCVIFFRAFFLKLVSILQIPLVRVTMCNSPDSPSIASHYSNQIVDFVREVLDIIPRSVYRILAQIVDIEQHQLDFPPPRFEAKHLKAYAQLNERYELSKLTHRVSIFTEGVLAMERTLLGVIEVHFRSLYFLGSFFIFSSFS